MIKGSNTMPSDIFIKFSPKVEGESGDAVHRGEIEIMSYGFGVTNQGTSHHGGGAGAGKANFQDLHFNKSVDRSTPNLLKFTAEGKHFEEALITVRKAGGGQQEYLKITLTDVFITSYHSDGHSGAVPSENFTLNFTKVKLEYWPQKADGSLDASVSGGYDVKENKSF
jgi:type VI secretion system secreted protein Hcp